MNAAIEIEKRASLLDTSAPGVDGPAIRAARKAAGLTLDQAAHNASIRSATWQAIETGDTPNPRIKTLQTIADTLGVNLPDLLIAPTP